MKILKISELIPLNNTDPDISWLWAGKKMDAMPAIALHPHREETRLIEEKLRPTA